MAVIVEPAGRLSVKPRVVAASAAAGWSSLMNWEVVEVDSVVAEVVVVEVVLVVEVAVGSEEVWAM